MPQPEAVAQSIASAIAAAGLTPHIKRQAGSIRVETATPEPMSWTAWDQLLAALGRGDRFGMEVSAQGSVAWAVVLTDAPPGEAAAAPEETGPPA
ncbi:hypothetical protein ACHZ98_35085 [Streptomyces sp. MAR4 CNY-716]